jgi:DNA/RNA-binding domain of Phe-tRNA-synthetase-like protein
MGGFVALFKATTKVHGKHPGLNFYGVKVENLQVTEKLLYVKARKKKIQKDFREIYTLDNLKAASQVKAIRDLFTAMGCNPEENLNAVENLAALILKGGLPSINSVVDACNLASLQTLMQIGVFDANKVNGEIVLDLSEAGEEYEAIGLEKEVLTEGLVILRDDDGVISRPMFKDSKRTMITENTYNVYIITVQYLPISYEEVTRALEVAVDLVTASSQGNAGIIQKFSDIYLN